MASRRPEKPTPERSGHVFEAGELVRQTTLRTPMHGHLRGAGRIERRSLLVFQERVSIFHSPPMIVVSVSVESGDVGHAES